MKRAKEKRSIALKRSRGGERGEMRADEAVSIGCLVRCKAEHTASSKLCDAQYAHSYQRTKGEALIKLFGHASRPTLLHADAKVCGGRTDGYIQWGRPSIRAAYAHWMARPLGDCHTQVVFPTVAREDNKPPQVMRDDEARALGRLPFELTGGASAGGDGLIVEGAASAAPGDVAPTTASSGVG